MTRIDFLIVILKRGEVAEAIAMLERWRGEIGILDGERKKQRRIWP